MCFSHHRSLSSVLQGLEDDAEALGDFSLSEVPDDFFANVQSCNDESPLNVDYLETQEIEESRSPQAIKHQECQQPDTVTELQQVEQVEYVVYEEVEPEQSNPDVLNQQQEPRLSEFWPQHKQINGESQLEQGNQFYLSQDNFDNHMSQHHGIYQYQLHQQQQNQQFFQTAQSGGLYQFSQHTYQHGHKMNVDYPESNQTESKANEIVNKFLPLSYNQYQTNVYFQQYLGPQQQNPRLYDVAESTIDLRQQQMEHQLHAVQEFDNANETSKKMQKVAAGRSINPISNKTRHANTNFKNIDFHANVSFGKRTKLSTITGQEFFYEPLVETRNPVVTATKSFPPAISSVPTRKRSSVTQEMRAILTRSFNISPFPCRMTRINLSKELGMDPRQVQIWFQNMRSKEKMGKKSSRM